MSEMKIAFNTSRLRVFHTRVKPTDHNRERNLFVAFRTDEDRPMVCATALISDAARGFSSLRYVDWLEVTSEYRRQGFGRELLCGIELQYGWELDYSAGSDLGEKFIAAIDRGRK